MKTDEKQKTVSMTIDQYQAYFRALCDGEFKKLTDQIPELNDIFLRKVFDFGLKAGVDISLHVHQQLDCGELIVLKEKS